MSEAAEQVAEYRDALQAIYDHARMIGYLADGSGGPGVCAWCDAPPPTDRTDHDVACPAAIAAYALRLPGYCDNGSDDGSPPLAQSEPSIDVERLENAIDTVAVIVDHRQGTHVSADDAEAIIDEYARLSERTKR